MKTHIWMIEAHMGEDGHVDIERQPPSREHLCDICDRGPAWGKWTHDIIAGWRESKLYAATTCIYLCSDCTRREGFLW